MGSCNSKSPSECPPATFNDKNVCKATKDIIFFEEDGPAVAKGDYVIEVECHGYGLVATDSVSVKILSFEDDEWTVSAHFVVVPRDILKPI